MKHKDLQDRGVVPLPAHPLVPAHGRPTGADVEAHLLGIPDALPPTWCRKCQAEVQPEGKGKCPRCGAFLKLNFVTRKHPINVARVDQLYAQLVAEYQPQSMVARTTCRHLAAAWERLEHIKPGSPEWQRLTAVSQTLSQSLRDTRTETPTSTAALDMSSLSTADLAERAAFVAERLLDLALAEKAGRKDVTRAASANRTQQQAAIVERQTAELVEAAESGAPVTPLPAWFTAWLEKQHGTPVDESAPARGQEWTGAWLRKQRGQS